MKLKILLIKLILFFTVINISGFDLLNTTETDQNLIDLNLLKSKQQNIVYDDFDGDGVREYAFFVEKENVSGIVVAIPLDNEEYKYEIWYEIEKKNFTESKIDYRFVSGDFNSDGLADIACMYNHGAKKADIYVFLSNGVKFKRKKWWDCEKGGYAIASVKSRFVSGDFNGDGKDDVAALYDYGKNEAVIHVFKSDGKKFSKFQSWWKSGRGGYALASVNDRVVSGDFNNDGYDDIAALYDYGKKQVKIHVFLSQGKKFSKWKTWWDSGTGKYSAVSTYNVIVSLDVNGDQFDDILTIYNYLKNDKMHAFISHGSKFEYIKTDINIE